MPELTPRQAGERLGISRQAVVQAIWRGSITAQRVESPAMSGGWHYLIDEDEVERYRREHLKGREKE